MMGRPTEEEYGGEVEIVRFSLASRHAAEKESGFGVAANQRVRCIGSRF